MNVTDRARSMFRTGYFSAGAIIFVILGILAMHAMSPITECSSPNPTGMTAVHTARTATHRVVTADRSGDTRSIGGTHGPNQCTATPVRKALLDPPSMTQTIADRPLVAAAYGDRQRPFHRPLIPDQLSVAGGLRR